MKLISRHGTCAKFQATKISDGQSGVIVCRCDKREITGEKASGKERETENVYEILLIHCLQNVLCRAL